MSLSAHAIIDDFARSSMNCPPSPARITTTAAVEARIAGACVRSLRYATNSCGMMHDVFGERWAISNSEKGSSGVGYVVFVVI